MELIQDGYIGISGGCEVYEEAKITFKPQKGSVLVSLDNGGGYFWLDNNNHVVNFSKTIDQKTAQDFFKKLDDILSNKKETQSISSRNATVKIYLPFKDKAIKIEWNETRGIKGKTYEIDPLLDLIEDIIQKINKL